MSNSKAVVLLSGGMDSATVAAIAKTLGHAIYALSISYGQRQILELQAATLIAKQLGVTEHIIADIDLRLFRSALTGQMDIPKGRNEEQIRNGKIPTTYVPARNTLFLSHALAWAESIGARNIFIGVHALDYSGYPDCRPEYLDAFQKMANLATRMGTQENQKITISAPLINATKADIIRQGMRLGVDYGLTISCYDPEPTGACGSCDACQLRRNGFQELNCQDPAPYR